MSLLTNWIKKHYYTVTFRTSDPHKAATSSTNTMIATLFSIHQRLGRFGLQFRVFSAVGGHDTGVCVYPVRCSFATADSINASRGHRPCTVFVSLRFWPTTVHNTAVCRVSISATCVFQTRRAPFPRYRSARSRSSYATTEPHWQCARVYYSIR